MIALILSAVAVLTSGPFTVTPNPCPWCPYRMRFSADGRQGFVNVSRVGEKAYVRMAERALGLMKKASDAKKPDEACPPKLWSAWNAPGVADSDAVIVRVGHAMETNGLQTASDLQTNPFLRAMSRQDLDVKGAIVQRDEDVRVLVKDADSAFGPARYLALYNGGNGVKEIKIGFQSVGLGGDVEVLDLCERADIGVFRETLTLRVLPHGARFLRLDAAKRLALPAKP